LRDHDVLASEINDDFRLVPFWAMRLALYCLIRMVIEMASKSAAFFLLLIFCRA
jgi:hypothetical protein